MKVMLQSCNNWYVLREYLYTVDKYGNLIKIKVLKWRKIKDNKDTLVYGIIKEILLYEK